MFHVKRLAAGRKKSPKSETAAGLLRTAAPLVDVGCEREGYGYLKREWRQGWPPSHVLQKGEPHKAAFQ